MRIDDIEVCQPITELVSFLIKNDFKIIEQKIADYHFHEVIIKMKKDSSPKAVNISIEKISQPKPGTFFCECHWSSVIIE